MVFLLAQDHSLSVRAASGVQGNWCQHSGGGVSIERSKSHSAAQQGREASLGYMRDTVSKSQ